MSCDHCTADTPDGIVLCDRCRKTASVSLTNIAAYYSDLDRVPTTGGQRRRSNTAPDPTGGAVSAAGVDPVTEVDYLATSTITTWARCLHDDRYGLVRTPPIGVPALSGWLEAYLPTIASLEWAGQMLSELLVLERRLRRVVSGADTGQFVGHCENQVSPEQNHGAATCACACHQALDEPCDMPGGCSPEVVTIEAQTCGEPLYAATGDRWVRCLACNSTWDAPARRRQLVLSAQDELAPVAVLAHMAAAFIGEESVGKLEARIRQWVQRSKLEGRGTKVYEGRPRKVYRMGDVLDLLTDTPGSSRSEESA